MVTGGGPGYHLVGSVICTLNHAAAIQKCSLQHLLPFPPAGARPPAVGVVPVQPQPAGLFSIFNPPAISHTKRALLPLPCASFPFLLQWRGPPAASLCSPRTPLRPPPLPPQWRVPLLSEFFPSNPHLQGLCINRGQEIRIRLRPQHSPSEFHDDHHVLQVVLHELTHIVHSEYMCLTSSVGVCSVDGSHKLLHIVQRQACFGVSAGHPAGAFWFSLQSPVVRG